MKRTIIFSIVALFLFSLVSCDKDDIVDELVPLTEEEAAEVIITSLGTAESGMIAEVEESSEMSQPLNPAPGDTSLTCGQTGDTTITKSLASGARTYDYSLDWQWTVNCLRKVPVSIDFVSTSAGNYVTPKVKSDDTGTHTFKVEGLLPNTTAYAISGGYTRTGTQETTGPNAKLFNSNIVATTDSIMVDKQTNAILSGQIDVTITGSGTSVTAFTHVGQVVFNGNKSATLTINGTQYPINW